jgi:hypothetical protein
MITCGERRTGQSSDMGWSPWGAGCVNGARPVLGGGEAQSIKSMLYAKLKWESPLYSPRVADRAFTQIKVNWRQPGDFKRYAIGESTIID